MSKPDPAEARGALARAREARLKGIESLPMPWWRLAVGPAVYALYLSAFDYGAVGLIGILLGIAVLIIARRFFRGFAVARGALDRGALTRSDRRRIELTLFALISIQLFAGSFVQRRLTGTGMPHWIREHPYTTVALPCALLAFAMYVLIQAMVRRMARRTASR